MMRESGDLRLHIAEKWEPADYISAFSAIQSIYYKIVVFDHEWEFQPRRARWRSQYPARGPLAELAEINESYVRSRMELADYQNRLIVDRISHASPGFMDFLGFGEGLQAIDSMLGRLIDVLTLRKQRIEADHQAKVRTEYDKQNLNTIKIENARKLLELRRDFPDIDDSLLLSLLVQDQTQLESLIGKGLITGPRDHHE